jgi:hypothetical protein
LKSYETEIEGQHIFYKERLNIDPDIHHGTDGVYRGNLIENKLKIEDINKVLFQAIKYASRIRIRGEKLPANIILNDLNGEIAYVFKSELLLTYIEKQYFGAASKDNDGFDPKIKYKDKIDYSNSDGLANLLKYINSDNYTKYYITKTNIFGLSCQYYKHEQNKDLFLKGQNAEIRNPKILNDRVYSYKEGNNLEFKDIMDCLNPSILQREQGAYYTPFGYVKKMQEFIIKAVSNIPKNMNYVIIDRCAGVGNLEEGLPDEIIKNCILSTIEPNEYQILLNKFQDKCAVVIPDTNALNYDVIPAERDEKTDKTTNDYVREKINDQNCVVILVENPPYSESGSGGSQNTGNKDNLWKNSFIYNEIKKEYKGVVLNELGNLFIWSGFKYYLNKKYDSYILFSPSKYWRNHNLVNKKYIDGFLCNRKEFHASQQSAISCIWWSNIDKTYTELPPITPYNIINNKAEICKEANGNIILRKANINMTEAYDKRKFRNDKNNGILFESNGLEYKPNGRKISVNNPIYNKNIVAYIIADGFLIDRKHVGIIRGAGYRGHGFYVRSDNFIEKLPLFVAGCFPYDKWWKTDVYSKCYDGKGKYLKNKSFLRKCLIYTCLTAKNKCRTIKGSDKRFYKNELCFDGKTTLAYKCLETYFPLSNDIENTLMKYWNDVMFEVKKTKEYNKAFKYGLWQIKEEINIKISTGNKDRYGNEILKYKYTELNTEIIKLEKKLREYYQKEIINDLFKYELIK